MGTVKDESRRKSCDLHVRLTDADMQTVRSNCRIAGYRSMSRFVRMRLTSSCMPRRTAVQENAAGNVPDWMQEQIEKVAQQIRGVAKNYNQSVTVMNTLVRHVADRDSQRMIIRRAARLDALTHELVGILQDIRGTVGELKESLSQQEGLKELDELNQVN
ncbi:MAG: hypothetical protein LKJ87_08780 [Bacteroidales bacterium]|jgi:hypothetical protein|nr:hypothetical protein [Bacteroidales bacterium]